MTSQRTKRPPVPRQGRRDARGAQPPRGPKPGPARDDGPQRIAKLLARFYDPREGRITIDGHDLRTVTQESLRSQLGIVPQEGFLFAGTVWENIAFGRPGASRAEIEAAAQAIGAHEFIAALPEGYDTDVHRRGGRLSAGQRQLVSFARAFLADPAVLILDEATSSLDVPSERLVQHGLHTLLAERTALIIAHRLPTVEIADRVLVMDDGRIVEDGTPGELVGGIAVPTGGMLIGGSESKYYMRISDARDGTPLWADATGEAGLVSNSGKRLVSNLRKRMDGK